MRIGVAGFGFMGRMHAACWQRIAGVELVAMADPLGRREAAGGNLGSAATSDLAFVPVAASLEELLALPLDAVDLCIPTHLHQQTAIQCLQAGKHVLVEKPMALDGTACDAMMKAASEAKRTLMVGHVLRFWGEYQPLLEAARSGSLGRLLSLDLRRQCAVPGWNEWIHKPELSGGGVFDLLIHDVDMCLAVAGVPEALSAMGSGDWMDAQLRYGDVASVRISGGWNPAPKFPFSMGYSARFEAGTIEFASDGKPPMLYRTDASAEPEPLAGTTVDAFEAELSYFAECVRAGHAPERCRMEDSALAVRLTKVLSDARAHRGEWITWE